MTNKTDTKNPDEKIFYLSTHSLSVRLGGVLNFRELNKSDGDKSIPWLLGLQYMFESETWKHFEMGMDYHSNQKLYLTGGYKFVFDRNESLRPYYKIGLSMRFDQGDHLETPFDPDSYALLVAVGLEDLLEDHQSIRIDFEVYGGGSDFMAVIAAGYAWGW